MKRKLYQTGYTLLNFILCGFLYMSIVRIAMGFLWITPEGLHRFFTSAEKFRKNNTVTCVISGFLYVTLSLILVLAWLLAVITYEKKTWVSYLGLRSFSANVYKKSFVITLAMLCSYLLMRYATDSISPKPLIFTENAWVLSADILIRPIMLELLFRGFIIKKLAHNPWRAHGAILLTALLYMLLLGDVFVLTALFVFVLHCLLGWSYYKSNSLLLPIVLHVFTRFVLMFYQDDFIAA